MLGNLFIFSIVIYYVYSYIFRSETDTLSNVTFRSTGVCGTLWCVMRPVCCYFDGTSIEHHMVKKFTCQPMIKHLLLFFLMIYLSRKVYS